MLKIPPVPYRRHPPKRRTAAAPDQSGLTITDVSMTGLDTQLTLTFSGNITWDHVQLPAAFEQLTSDGYQSCIEVVEVGSNWITLQFESGTYTENPWQLNGALAGISPAIAWPQNGTISA